MLFKTRLQAKRCVSSQQILSALIRPLYVSSVSKPGRVALYEGLSRTGFLPLEHTERIHPLRDGQCRHE